MIFSVMGFNPGKDELVYEQSFDLSVADLTPIMHWVDASDCIGVDFPLSKTQAAKIADLASIELPQNLDFFLSSHD
ncbi:hypothetical protein [Pseudomonas sp. H3(2019)]|uniref:DUF7683 domain-containing protein n=1 Tax=Pseudomonas sp. H3(2019) TaxID=2598724 RepID=UPI001193A38E|nr:hypothetical protein [Pseudomonas sp. H3(2019)]TVT80593.1 hypothetical protein FPT12_22745 [Pseudomonas sp. H3(2019)]